MELMACVKSLDWVRDNAPWPDVTRVLIITDSQYITHNRQYPSQVTITVEPTAAAGSSVSGSH
jgi:hypothetical protein